MKVRRLSTVSSGWRLPMTQVPDTLRNYITLTVGEFTGTFLFLFFSFAGTGIAMTPKPAADANPNTSNLFFASLAFGLSLTANVSFALTLVGALSPLRGAWVFFVQLVAGIAAAGVVSCLFPGPMNVNTRLGGGTSIARGLFIEMFLTAQLVFVILMLAVTKHKSTYLAPIGIGLTFFLCELVGIYYTGGSLNPARSLGPDVINRTFPGYHWIYWIGPGLGTLVATGLYGLLILLRYETCNPGQDYSESKTNLVLDPSIASHVEARGAQRPVSGDTVSSHVLGAETRAPADR